MGTQKCLGTVQLGLDYGINNKTGKPDKYVAWEILDEAVKNNMIIDTAEAYGDSECVIGDYISNRNVKNISIITKIMPRSLRLEKGLQDMTVESLLMHSLERLGLSSVYGCLLHTPEELYDETVMDALDKCKSKGLVRAIGVSVYDYIDGINAVEDGRVDIVQVPYNILDRRFDTKEFTEKAKRNNVVVFARSPFLQGLLTCSQKEIPDYLSDVGLIIESIDRIVEHYGYSRIEACMLFSLSASFVDYVVYGVETYEQMMEDLSVQSDVEAFYECRNALIETAKQLRDNSIIFPSLWDERKKGTHVRKQ